MASSTSELAIATPRCFFATAEDSVLLNIFYFASQDISSIAALSSTCRRLHSICQNEIIWFCAYRFHFNTWSNGLSFQSIPTQEWRKTLKECISVRTRWSRYGQCYGLDQTADRQNAEQLDRLANNLNNKPISVIPIIGKATDDQATQQLFRSKRLTGLKLERSFAVDYTSPTTGIIAVCGHTNSTSDYQVLIWSFPDWKTVGRFDIPQTVGSSREILADINWNQRLLTTKLIDTTEETPYCHGIRIYDASESTLRLIDIVNIPMNKFKDWLTYTLPSPQESASHSPSADDQSKQRQVTMVGIDKDTMYPWFIVYDNKQSEEHRVKTLILAKKKTMGIYMDFRHFNYIATEHEDGLFCIWSPFNGKLIAQMAVAPGLAISSIAFMPVLHDQSHDGSLSRLLVIAGSRDGSKPEGCIFSFSANSPSSGVSTIVSLVDEKQQKTSNDKRRNLNSLIKSSKTFWRSTKKKNERFGFDESDITQPADKQSISVVNTHNIQLSELCPITSTYTGMRNQYKRWDHQIQLFIDTVKTQDQQYARLDMIDSVMFDINDRLETPHVLGSLLFVRNTCGILIIMDLDTHEVIARLPCNHYSQVIKAGNDIILISENSIERLAVDDCKTLEFVEFK
ncbi:hypothetical protein BDF19DRAFT_413280 [Syncephalis fuscata]|nr:hypothetical protein BDF19DRAFT_413280 [Syncephalis fuscata]